MGMQLAGRGKAGLLLGKITTMNSAVAKATAFTLEPASFSSLADLPARNPDSKQLHELPFREGQFLACMPDQIEVLRREIAA